MTALDELACRFVLNGIEPSRLSEIAESLIAEGFDTPGLTALLICDSGYAHDQVSLFARFLSEIGLELPAKENAALALSTIIARNIVAGTTTPYAGAYLIWKDVLNQIDEIPPQLCVFKRNASAIEDCLHDTRQFGSDHDELIASCSDEIFTAANTLVHSAIRTSRDSET